MLLVNVDSLVKLTHVLHQRLRLLERSKMAARAKRRVGLEVELLPQPGLRGLVQLLWEDCHCRRNLYGHSGFN